MPKPYSNNQNNNLILTFLFYIITTKTHHRQIFAIFQNANLMYMYILRKIKKKTGTPKYLVGFNIQEHRD